MNDGDDAEFPSGRTIIYRPGSTAPAPRTGIPPGLPGIIPGYVRRLRVNGSRRLAEALEDYYRSLTRMLAAEIEHAKMVANLRHLPEIIDDHIAETRHGFEQNQMRRQIENDELKARWADGRLRRIEAEERLEAKLRPKGDASAETWRGPAAFRELFEKQKEYDEAKRFVEQERERLRQAYGKEENWPPEERHLIETLKSMLAQLYSRSFG